MATTANPAYSITSSGPTGQPADDPMGSHRRVRATGASAMHAGTTVRRPRAEKATTNDAR